MGRSLEPTSQANFLRVAMSQGWRAPLQTVLGEFDSLATCHTRTPKPSWYGEASTVGHRAAGVDRPANFIQSCRPPKTGKIYGGVVKQLHVGLITRRPGANPATATNFGRYPFMDEVLAVNQVSTD